MAGRAEGIRNSASVAQTLVRRGQELGYSPPSAARNGRLKPLPRGVEADLWKSIGLSGAPGARLHGSRPSARIRKQGGSSTELVHRFQQIGNDARAQHLQTVLLRESEETRRSRSGWQAVCRNHRSRLEIGGRYSALSNFGLVPAAAIGLDVAQMLQRAQLMIDACAASVQVRENPGTLLGNLLGVLGQNGHDKVTIIASPKIRDFGAWLEQLLAESTGKQGKGLIPVDREELAAPDKYGPDRVFVYLRLQSAADLDQDSRLDALERAGGSVLRISLSEPYDLAQEFFRWEFATAVAGSVLGLSPFDQPDVEANKLETRRLTSEYEQTGALPKESPLYEEGGIQLFADERNASALRASAGRKPRLVDHLRAHLSRLRPGDYLALLAFIEMNEEHEKALSVIRHAVRDRTRAATCLEFGPRFLHSTGQAYKGGPNSGVFLQITCTDAFDLPIPGQKYTFGVVKAAQARGDFQVLAQRGRRALRVHFAKDVREGLAALQSAVLE